MVFRCACGTPHPLQGVSRTLSSLCFRLKNSEKIVLVLKAESKAVVEIALPRPQNELQRTYFGIFVRVVCFVTKPKQRLRGRLSVLATIEIERAVLEKLSRKLRWPRLVMDRLRLPVNNVNR